MLRRRETRSKKEKNKNEEEAEEEEEEEEEEKEEEEEEEEEEEREEEEKKEKGEVTNCCSKDFVVQILEWGFRAESYLDDHESDEDDDLSFYDVPLFKKGILSPIIDLIEHHGTDYVTLPYRVQTARDKEVLVNILEESTRFTISISLQVPDWRFVTPELLLHDFQVSNEFSARNLFNRNKRSSLAEV
ncbi:hypothetical protein LSTR_LSTR010349 [Laodelphax striatellus]|uniref:Uncharacterized protein n=1 Tax=Laodelphax striatellus TaxID=195883 RepID=A0A482X0C7_LAOST|nr:hypothetical protein LSTR_LSTR010349 [Laodelphax striatellus]